MLLSAAKALADLRLKTEQRVLWSGPFRRYGKTESRSLEDDVANLFESLGDTVIKLKKNAPNSDDIFGSGIIGGAGSGQTAN